jgi:predicted nucleotidyltransferase
LPFGARRKEADSASRLRKELARIVRRLKILGAEKIILFGSFARGREDDLTDLDLFVVLQSDLSFVERTARLYRAVSPRVAVDLLAYTPEEWQRMQERPFVKKALQEGRVLYEKVFR